MHMAFVLLFLLPAVLAQTSIQFGSTVTTGVCNGYGLTYNYTLTMSPPSSSAASQFVVGVQNVLNNGMVNSLITYNVTASLSPDMQNAWSVSADTQGTASGELWIPVQTVGTIFYISVLCVIADNSTFILRPVLPTAMSTPTSVAGLNQSQITSTDPTWWVIPALGSFNPAYVWGELCSVPDVNYSLFYMRVVFPQKTALGKACQVSNSRTYQIYQSDNANYLFYDIVKNAITILSSTSEFYVSFYAISNTLNFMPATYSVYSTLMKQNTLAYYGSIDGQFSAQAVQLNNDLFVVGGGIYFPNDVGVMKIYYTNTSSNNMIYFSSACYLKTQMNGALFTGTLKNGSNDNQMLLSNTNIVKAPGFYNEYKGLDTQLYASVVYNDYVVVTTLYGSDKIYLPISHTMIGVVAGLAALSALLLIGLIILGIQYGRTRSQYQSLNR